MKNSHLVSDILDKCGEPVKAGLDAFTVSNELMTVLDAMNLELIQSGKGRAVYKYATTLAANTREGTLADPDATGDYDAVWEVLPAGSMPSRSPIEIYDDMQDLVEAEGNGIRSIMFTGLKGTDYILSFTPGTALNVELWSEKVMLLFSRSNFGDESSIPDLFESLAVLRTVWMVLDHLLLPDVKKDYTRFVNARKGSMSVALGIFEDRWLAFRSGIRDDNKPLQRRWYDPIDDLLGP